MNHQSTAGPRTITKYPNRRLYDTQKSAYVTFGELAELLRAGHQLRVIERATGNDITRDTLLQVLRELEASRAQPLLPAERLSELIAAV